MIRQAKKGFSRNKLGLGVKPIVNPGIFHSGKQFWHGALGQPVSCCLKINSLEGEQILNMNRIWSKSRTIPMLAALVLSAVLALPASAQTGREAVESQKSFDQTVAQLKSAVSQGGMMVMGTVDQGNMLSMTGLKLKATLFLVGNPTIGKQLFEQNPAVGLYVPLRIFVYEDKGGKTFVSYDKPSALLEQLHNGQIDKTAGMLDQKIQNLVQMVTH